MSYLHSFFESLRFHTRNTWKCIKIEWRIRNKLKRSWPVTNATNLWTVWSCCGDSPWRHSQSCQDRPSSTSILFQQDLYDAWGGEKKKTMTSRASGQAAKHYSKWLRHIHSIFETSRHSIFENNGKSSYPMGSRDTVKSFKLSRILFNGAVRNCLVSGTYFSLKNVRACIFK